MHADIAQVSRDHEKAGDGERDIAGICRWAQEELGLQPTVIEVRNVITTLGDLGLIEGGAAGAAVTSPTNYNPSGGNPGKAPASPSCRKQIANHSGLSASFA